MQGAPDWLIEILSSEQSSTKLIAKIQTCIAEGRQLGWLVDAEEQAVMAFQDAQMRLITDEMPLPVLPGLSLSLTVADLVSWLP